MKPIGKKFLRHEMQIIPKQIKLLAYYAFTYVRDPRVPDVAVRQHRTDPAVPAGPKRKATGGFSEGLYRGPCDGWLPGLQPAYQCHALRLLGSYQTEMAGSHAEGRDSKNQQGRCWLPILQQAVCGGAEMRCV